MENKNFRTWRHKPIMYLLLVHPVLNTQKKGNNTLQYLIELKFDTGDFKKMFVYWYENDRPYLSSIIFLCMIWWTLVLFLGTILMFLNLEFVTFMSLYCKLFLQYNIFVILLKFSILYLEFQLYTKNCNWLSFVNKKYIMC